MGVKDRAYQRLPVPLQNLAVTTFGYRWYRQRFGGVFAQELRAFRDREAFTSEQWSNYQRQQLSHILHTSALRVPYYRAAFKEAGLSSRELASITPDDIRLLPTLDKATLRAQGRTGLMADGHDRRGQYFASSGSTGTPTSIYFSAETHQRWSAAFESRIRLWAGVDRKHPRGMIGGRRVVPDGLAHPPYYRYNAWERQTYFSAYHISRGTAPDYVRGMLRHGVSYMTGYAMSNYFLARFIEELGIQAPALEAVITSSERLTPEARQTFLRVYGCRSFDSYSGVEACGLISECQAGSLHLSPDVAVVEILDEHGDPVPPGGTGEAVCTGLLNHDQPLIRYRIGDLLTLATSQSCECGRQMPIISDIVGRIEDTVVGPDGRELVRFHGVFIDLPSIVEGQIIQWDLDRFEILVVATERLPPEVDMTLRQRLRSQVGDVRVDVRVVEEIPRGANGKVKAVVSHVERA